MTLCTCPCGNIHTPGRPDSIPSGNGGGVTVILENAGDRKINVIREIRGITNLGLKESKGITDLVPSVIIQDVTLEQATEAKWRLEAVGAIVNLLDSRPMDEAVVDQSILELKKVTLTWHSCSVILSTSR